MTVLVAAVSLTYGLSHYFGLDFGLSAGMMAGALTATPVLVGAQDALNSGLATIPRNMDFFFGIRKSIRRLRDGLSDWFDQHDHVR